jgi:predicted secreted acid phosphatase
MYATTQSRRARRSTRRRLKAACVGSTLVSLLALAASTTLQAQTCPAERQPNLPKLEEPTNNIEKHKDQLRAYQKGAYSNDIQLVLDDALAYVMSRADKVERPAVVLDIDETSLSNWDNIDADDFGFIGGGECPMKPNLACGFPAWIDRAEAIAIDPTRRFFNALRAKNIAVFFITGRKDAQRRVTILNLHHEGFFDWTGLMTRPDDDQRGSIVPFKSEEREKIESGDKRYHIVATIGDQQSDLDGGHAECGFKIPNPFYFIK